MKTLVLLALIAIFTSSTGNGTVHTHPAYTFYQGSLKKNITRVANRFGWHRIVWEPEYDYQWFGKTKVAADSIEGVFEKVLDNYPLQAVFYQGNHVLLIRVRNKPL